MNDDDMDSVIIDGKKGEPIPNQTNIDEHDQKLWHWRLTNTGKWTSNTEQKNDEMRCDEMSREKIKYTSDEWIECVECDYCGCIIHKLLSKHLSSYILT